MTNFLKTYGLLAGMGATSLVILWDMANLMVTIQAMGIMSTMLLFIALVMDGREGRGLFPDYDEGSLIKIAHQDPLASAVVVATKNLLLVVILILAVLFVKPN